MMKAQLTGFLSLVALLALLSFGGCSKAPVDEVAVENPVEKPAQRPREKTMAELFAEGDADGDGRLSSEELPAKVLLEWDVIDLNADGYIDADEQAAYLNPPGSEAVVKVEVAEKETVGENAERGEGRFGNFFTENDADGDGRLSMAEAPGKLQERFTTLDGNGDGFIDADEQAAMRKRFKDQASKRQRQFGKGGGKGGRFDPRAFGGFDPGNFGGIRSGGSTPGGSGGSNPGGKPRTIVPPK